MVYFESKLDFVIPTLNHTSVLGPSFLKRGLKCHLKPTFKYPLQINRK